MLSSDEKALLQIHGFEEYKSDKMIWFAKPDLGERNEVVVYRDQDGKYVMDYCDVVYAGDYSDTQRYDSLAELLVDFVGGRLSRL